jgi:hypothetical protein
VLLGLATVLLAPVTITRPGGASSAPGWDRVGESVFGRVQVDFAGPGAVRISRPTLRVPETLTPATPLVTSGGFALEAASQQYLSVGPGRLILDGTYGDLALAVYGDADSGPLRITRQNGAYAQVQVVHPSEAPGTWRSVELPSPDSLLLKQRLFGGRAFNVPAGSAVRVGPWKARTSGSRVSTLALLKASIQAVVRGWLLFGSALALLAACWLLGLSLLRGHLPPPAVAAGFGFCLLACVANTLSYALPMQWVCLLLIVVLPVVALQRLLGPSARQARAALRPEGRRLLRLVGITLGPAAIAFWPVFTWGSWFAGQYKTDLYEYTSLSSLLRNHSMLALRHLPQAQASGNVTAGAGIVWRSVDSVVASFASTLIGLTSVGGFVVVGLLLFLLFGVTVLGLAEERSGRLGLILGTCALLSPVLTSLFLEDYLSQYFFVALLPTFAVLLSHGLPEGRHQSGRMWALASVTAVETAVYPYFFALVLAFCGLALLARRRTRLRLASLVFPLLWRGLVATNLALLPVLNYGKTRGFERSLDAIARNVLLSGWTGPDVWSFVGGLRSYHARTVTGAVTGTDGALHHVVGVAGSAVGAGPKTAAMALVALAIILVASDIKTTVRNFPAGGLLVATVAGFTVFGSAYGLANRPYVMLKALWVAGALAPALLCFLSWRPRWRSLAVLGGSGLALLWTLTLVADRTAWLVPLQGNYDRREHLSVVPDLQALDRLLSRMPAGPAALLPGSQPLAGSDRDRIVAAHVAALLRDNGRECITCLGTSLPVVSCAATPAAVAVTVGTATDEVRCGLHRVARGEFQDLYARTRDAPQLGPPSH